MGVKIFSTSKSVYLAEQIANSYGKRMSISSLKIFSDGEFCPVLDENIRGEVLGINSSVSSLGQALPPVFAGLIAAATASYVPVIIASLIVFSAALVFIYKVKRHHIEPSTGRVII